MLPTPSRKKLPFTQLATLYAVRELHRRFDVIGLGLFILSIAPVPNGSR